MLKKILLNIDAYLFLIVVLAGILRLLYLDYAPPSLNWDEVSHGYNAYSILTTGKDEWGLSFPAIFRAYGDYKLPGYIYLTAISEKFLGLNELAVRLPGALAGIGTVIFTYLVVFELFKKKGLANLSAFLVAVEPWSLFLSRGAFEANLSLFFIVSGVYYFLKSFAKPKFLIPSAILVGLSVWTYNSARIFVPILGIVLVIVYWKELSGQFKKNKAVFVVPFAVILLFFIPMFIQLLQPIGQARYGKVSILDEGAIATINQARNTSKLPTTLNRLVNNRYAYFTQKFVINWASHYSGTFLFFKGGTDYQFSIPGRGIIYWVDIIPMIVGLLWLVVKRSKANALLIAWFLLSPIPSAITNEAPQVLRAIVMLPVPMIITATGVYEIANWLHIRFRISSGAVIAIYVVLIYLFLENYGIDYIKSYRINYSWSWQYGYKQAVTYAKDHYGDYDKIITTKDYGEPHEFFLFYLKYSPDKYRNDPNLIRFEQSNWFWVDRFDKFYFVNDWQIPKDKAVFVLESKKETIDCTKKSTRCLLITSPGNYPKNWRILSTINFLDGKPAFQFLDNQ